MPKPGSNIGGIRTLEDLRQRCWIDPATDCWHLRTARGRKPSSQRALKVWFHPNGESMHARRLALILSEGKEVVPGHVVTAKCDSFDCINPGHLLVMTKAEEVAMHIAKGCFSTARKRAANILSGARRSRTAPEIWQWIYESPQNSKEVADILGLTHSHVCLKRKAFRGRMGSFA